MNWYCILCWRQGKFEVSDLAEALTEHSEDVKRDMAAFKIPAGSDDRSRNTAMMRKYPGVYCEGDVKFGVRSDKPRFKRPPSMLLPFPE